MSPESKQLAEDLEKFMQENPDEDPAKFLAFWFLMHIGSLFVVFFIGGLLMTAIIHYLHIKFGLQL